SDAAEKDCPLVGPETASTATNYITYVVTVTPTTSDKTAVNIPETQNYEVKVPPEHDVKIIEKVVATCSQPATNDPSRSPLKGTPDIPEKGMADSKLPKVGPIAPDSHQLASEPITTEIQNGKTQDAVKLQHDGPTSIDTATSRANPNGESTSGKKGSDASNEVLAPISNEAESTETDNSVTVSDADHTASTATPQSGTTTEGAPNAGAGTSTSAGEGVKLPDRNTDASSSSSAWVRAPLLLLL
ncbi:hypothetical protein DQ04_24131000, partial [Trypanosoma grayi]|uniref:hypothetical protein n=1 Tax=Trypanosoma grayi TaxID=71804 RepID=UPI0004F44F6A